MFPADHCQSTVRCHGSVQSCGKGNAAGAARVRPIALPEAVLHGGKGENSSCRQRHQPSTAPLRRRRRRCRWSEPPIRDMSWRARRLRPTGASSPPARRRPRLSVQHRPRQAPTAAATTAAAAAARAHSTRLRTRPPITCRPCSACLARPPRPPSSARAPLLSSAPIPTMASICTDIADRVRHVMFRHHCLTRLSCRNPMLCGDLSFSEHISTCARFATPAVGRQQLYFMPTGRRKYCSGSLR